MFLSPLRLPRVLRIRTKSCGMANAFYVPAEWSINLCYEYYEYLESIAPKATSPQGFTRDEVIVGGFIDAIFHELGHALFDILNVPGVRARGGRRRPDIGLHDDAVRPGCRARHHQGRRLHLHELTNPRTRTEFADEHGAPAQRFFNYLCLAYGGEPDAFKDVVERGCCRRTAPAIARANTSRCAARSPRPSCRMSTGIDEEGPVGAVAAAGRRAEVDPGRSIELGTGFAHDPLPFHRVRLHQSRRIRLASAAADRRRSPPAACRPPGPPARRGCRH